MKRLLIVLFLISGTVFGAEKPAETLKKEFIKNYGLLIQEAGALAALDSEEPDWKTTEKQFFATRLAFKKIELFFSYLDHEYVKDHINGAPLPRIERKAPNLVIFDPSGFQIMEEALMERETKEFQRLADGLNNKLIQFETYIPKARLSERMVFEAMREGIIRLAAMGITGFDAPSEINALQECQMVVQSLNETISAYDSYLSAADKTEIQSLFSISETYFENADFNSFNRFGFIKDFINPLYKKLLETQHELQIETRDLVVKSEFSINYEADNIFDTDFLNYKYFSKYSNSGDQEKREQLGQLLFFDPILSHNNQRACASCHQPDMGFADGRPTSLAFDGEGVLDRNSPGLINSVFNTRFFWDARASTPEDQIEHVLFNPKEFNTDYSEIVEKLETCEEYVDLFKAAYPEFQTGRTDLISRYTIVASISAYIQSLRSFNSKFDQEIKKESTEVNEHLVAGFNIFSGKGKCATCHFVPTFAGNLPPFYNDTETEVLGVPETADQGNANLDPDLGRYANGRPKEKAAFFRHSFKTPTIRNIELTAPYMHNGVFPTLEEVVEFYNVGGGHNWGGGIAPENTTLGADSLHLTPAEIDDLILFMESLTDTIGLTGQPAVLPKSTRFDLNDRKIGGVY